jgi:hypothetical protein
MWLSVAICSLHLGGSLGHIWISMFVRITAWRSVSGRSSSCQAKLHKSRMAPKSGSSPALFDCVRMVLSPFFYADFCVPRPIMIGNSWCLTDVVRHGEEPKLCPPRVVISISGEPSCHLQVNRFDVSDPPTGTTYIGRCIGDKKKRKVEALVNCPGLGKRDGEGDLDFPEPAYQSHQ